MVYKPFMKLVTGPYEWRAQTSLRYLPTKNIKKVTSEMRTRIPGVRAVLRPDSPWSVKLLCTGVDFLPSSSVQKSHRSDAEFPEFSFFFVHYNWNRYPFPSVAFLSSSVSQITDAADSYTIQRRTAGWQMIDELKNIWKIAVLTLSKYYRGICLERLKKTKKHFIRYHRLRFQPSTSRIRVLMSVTAMPTHSVWAFT
jgi:hypothetical protein